MSALLADCQTIRDVLRLPQLPLLERRMLLERVYNKPRAWFIAHDDERLDEAAKEQLSALFERRLAGEPMAYIIGEREFMGLEFKVTPAVLIPRPETELLVTHTLEILLGQMAQGLKRPRVLDIGTGSGVVAICLKKCLPQAEVVAVDISEEALAVAQDNAQRQEVRIDFRQSDIYSAVTDEAPFNCIVSNPPYIHQEDEHLQQGDVRFEPSMALTDGADGLSLIRQIVAEAPHYLASEASFKPSLWLEHGYDQADAVMTILLENGFKDCVNQRDLAGLPRVSGGFLAS